MRLGVTSALTVVAAMAAAGAAGCAGETPRTQVMLEIDADEIVRDETMVLEVLVYGGDASRGVETYALRRTLRYGDGLTLSWPRRIAIVPSEPDPDRGYSVRVSIERDNGEMALRDWLRGGFVEERTILLPWRLAADCLERDCEEGLGCRIEGDEARCVDAFVDVTTFSELSDSTE